MEDRLSAVTSDASNLDAPSQDQRKHGACSRSLWSFLVNHKRKQSRRCRTAVRRARTLAALPMRRLQERLCGSQWASSLSKHEIWLLGVRYPVSKNGENESLKQDFLLDLRSRVWFSYRKGFEAIGPSKLTTDVGWGCLLRSGQMLLAQAFICHYLGRTWRRVPQSNARVYLEILELFRDSPSQRCPFSIHNILAVGGPYGMKPGSWSGPYAFCRSLEAAFISFLKGKFLRSVPPMAIHVVSGDANSECGGAPCICIDDVANVCLIGGDWSAVLLLIPLVLGVDTINPRYLPSLMKFFKFPHTVGILGGKPGTCTYLVGVQSDLVFYLDPHEVQQVVLMSPDDEEAVMSSYHSSNVRRMPLKALDPSLALGFYCQDQESFANFCQLCVELEKEAMGVPMFTVVQSTNGHRLLKETTQTREDDDFNVFEDDWQII